MTNLKITRQTEGVFYCSEKVPYLDFSLIGNLKEEALRVSTRRARLCTHPTPSSPHHMMLIVMHRDSTVAPHRHISKSESMMVVEGNADAVLFDEQGKPVSVITLQAPHEGNTFAYYMPEGVFHSVLPQSDWYVFVETTQGPFTEDGMEIAPWAPDLSDEDRVQEWRAGIEEAVRQLKRS